MAQFDVYRTREGDLLLDCQADLLDHLNSRFVVPLRSPDEAPPVSAQLNPTFTVFGEAHVMKTHFAAAIASRRLGDIVASLEDERYTILKALDMLISGF